MSVDAALKSVETSYLKLRTGQHPEFTRIVLEGAKNIISKGKVAQLGENILVGFPGAVFTLHGKGARITYKKENETILFSPGKFIKFKTFSLNNPDRLVIDVYGLPRLPEKNLQKKKNMPVKETPPKIKAKATKPLVKAAEKQGQTRKNKTAAETPPKIKAKATKPLVKAAEKQDQIDKNKTSAETPPKIKAKATKPLVKAAEKQGQTRKNKTAAETPDRDNVDNMSATGQYKKVRDYLKSGTPTMALNEISEYKLKDIESLAAYHFLYGEIYDAMKDYLPAITHFAMAALHADNNDLRERSLLIKSGLYLKLGFLYEAKSNYRIFVNNFSSSRYIREAHLGLAKSLSGIGNFSKAIEHYKKADPGAEAVFGMANALQRLGNVDEANAAYVKGLRIDNYYHERFPETGYFIGENKLMTGDKAEAKRLLKAIKSGPFKDRANISLGLMAMEETDIETAIKYFKSATLSKDREIRVEALIDLSTALLQSGKTQEAVSILEEIRYKYMFSSMYNQSTLKLARAYRDDGRLKESLPLLKQLAYSIAPPEEVHNDLQEILLEASEKTGKDIPDDLQFITLWNNFGKWLMVVSREQFLLQIVEPLKHEGGKPFLNVSIWLIENASEEIKAQAAAGMADYFVEMDDTEKSKKYLEMAIISDKLDDAIMRVEAKIYYAAGDLRSALETLMLIKEFGESDLDLFGNMVFDLKISELKDSQNVIDFYEKAVNRIGKDYVRLANILYDDDRKDEALKYYGIAHKKEEKDEWAMYRIGILAGLQEYELPRGDDDKQAVYKIGIEGGTKKAKEMFGDLQKGDSILSNLAKTKLMEIDILNRVAEVF